MPIIAKLGSEQRTATSLLTVSGVSSAVWLLAKYGLPSELADFLKASEPVWTRSSWAARQVAASTPLLPTAVREDVQRKIVQSGLVEAVAILTNLDELKRIKTIDRQLRMYLLHPPTEGNPFPLSKAIIARVALRSGLNKTERRDLRGCLDRLIDDPCYTSIIRRQLPKDTV